MTAAMPTSRVNDQLEDGPRDFLDLPDVVGDPDDVDSGEKYSATYIPRRKAVSALPLMPAFPWRSRADLISRTWTVSFASISADSYRADVCPVNSSEHCHEFVAHRCHDLVTLRQSIFSPGPFVAGRSGPGMTVFRGGRATRVLSRQTPYLRL